MADLNGSVKSEPRDRSPIRQQDEEDLTDSEKRDRDGHRDRDRERMRRGDRSARGGTRERDRDRTGRRAPADRRVFVSNIPYEYRWQDLKDLFRKEVGEVAYVELFNDENDKPRGCGIIEFDTHELALKAVEKMHRFELKGRKLVVKEDFDVYRDRYGRIERGGVRRDDRGDMRGRDFGPSGQNKWGNTYGLSPQFLESLGIDGPLVSRVFVANLDYKVDEKKLRDVFRLGGKVIGCELNRDKDGKSKGHGVVEFDHPVEAVQAISMFHNITLFDRKMSVRMDKVKDTGDLPSRLPDGLKGIGMGLGAGGNPLTDVSRNLPSIQGGNMANVSGSNMASGMGGAVGGGGMSGMMGGMGMNTGMGGMGSMGSTMAQGMGMGAMGTSAVGNTDSMNTMGGGAGTGGGMQGAFGSTMAGMSGMGSTGMGGQMNSAMVGTGSMLGGMGTGMGQSGYGSGASGAYTRDYEHMRGGSSGYNSSAMERDYRSNYRDANQDGGRRMRSSDCVMVSNLPLNTTWQTLRDKFRDVGEVRFAEIKEKGTGVVRFASERDAERAVTLMDRSRFDGRTIDVHLY